MRSPAQAPGPVPVHSHRPAVNPARQRAAWLQTLHRWHWISSAICLIGILLFTVTGITLNHAADIPARIEVVNRSAVLPAALQPLLAAGRPAHGPALPPALAAWLASELTVRDVQEVEWSATELYLPLPRPGGDAWLRIDRQSGAVEYEITRRGWVSYLNDLHKGRHTGSAWRWFIDIFALACLLFALTGLLILKHHAGNRPLTWPMVALGAVLPLLLVLLFIH